MKLCLVPHSLLSLQFSPCLAPCHNPRKWAQGHQRGAIVEVAAAYDSLFFGGAMTSLSPFNACDLLNLNPINLDVLTENYYLSYYLEYMVRWPSMMFKMQSLGSPVGYMIGKAEDPGKEWHSHITAVTVDYRFRRLGLGRVLVDQLKLASNADKCYFMDLYVRTSNKIAVNMYEGMGFSIFRRVLNYYGSGNNEDAFDMRMPLQRDKLRESLTKSHTTRESSYYDYVYDKQAFK